jgi:hypothetical protein
MTGSGQEKAGVLLQHGANHVTFPRFSEQRDSEGSPRPRSHFCIIRSKKSLSSGP